MKCIRGGMHFEYVRQLHLLFCKYVDLFQGNSERDVSKKEWFHNGIESAYGGIHVPQNGYGTPLSNF